MFTNYYKLLNVSSTATDEEIREALGQSTLSSSLVEEMTMVLQNKSLKSLYDEELKMYETAESKRDYQISNPILKCELEKLATYISNRPHEPIEIDEGPERFYKSCLWTIILFIILRLINCVAENMAHSSSNF